MKSAMMEKDALDKGIGLFNEGNYFEAHETWENLWLDAKEPAEKQFFQGLIMASGSFHHYKKRECAGASMLLSRSIEFLGPMVNRHPEIRLAEFVKALDALRDEFKRCSFNIPLDTLPKIGRREAFQ